MYLIEEIWIKIKDYKFHNVQKQGKHLKKIKNIKIYNKVLIELLNEFKIPFYNYYIWDKPGKFKLVLFKLKKEKKGKLSIWNYPYWNYPY